MKRLSISDVVAAPKRQRCPTENVLPAAHNTENTTGWITFVMNDDDDDDMWASDEDEDQDDQHYEEDWQDDYMQRWRYVAATGLWWTLSGRLWIDGQYKRWQ